MSDLPALAEKAFDYRGDVTLTLKDGTKLVGFVYNREASGSARCPEPFLEVMPAGTTEKVLYKYTDVTGIEFTGEDTAAGKSWDDFQAKEAARKQAAVKS